MGPKKRKARVTATSSKVTSPAAAETTATSSGKRTKEEDKVGITTTRRTKTSTPNPSRTSSISIGGDDQDPTSTTSTTSTRAASTSATTSSKKTTTTLVPSSPPVEEWYHQCTVGHYYERRNQIHWLEQAGVLETYLWPACLANNGFTYSHAVLMALLINCKAYSSTAFSPFSFLNVSTNDKNEKHQDINVIATSVQRFLTKLISSPSSQQQQHQEEGEGERYDLLAEKIHCFIHCLASSQDATLSPILHNIMKQYTSIAIWQNISERKRQYEMAKHPFLKQQYKTEMEDVEAGTKGEQLTNKFIPHVVTSFLQVLDTLSSSNQNVNEPTYSKQQHRAFLFLHRTLEFFIDLLSVPYTRPYVRTFLIWKHFAIRCMTSPIYLQQRWKHRQQPQQLQQRTPTTIFCHLVQMYVEMEQLAVDEYHPTQPLSLQQYQTRSHTSIHTLQRFCYKYYSDKLSQFIFTGITTTSKSQQFLMEQLSKLSTEELITLANKLRLIDCNSDEQEEQCIQQRSIILSILMYHHIPPQQPITEATVTLPLYPNETLLWEDIPPGNTFAEHKVLALPKLQLQFLTYADYLLRSYKLVRLESAYEIRADLVDAIVRVDPILRYSYSNEEDATNVDSSSFLAATNDARSTTVFKGWARMAVEISSFQFLQITKPNLGEVIPSSVIAEIIIDLKSFSWSIRSEWEELREHDILFLLTIDASQMTRAPAPLLENLNNDGTAEERHVPNEEDSTFPQRFGVRYVRGCMVLEMRDEAGVLLNDPSGQDGEGRSPQGTKRFIKVSLDPAQFAMDRRDGNEVYQTLNLVVRRKAKENNFKAVLETIRGLMKTNAATVNRCIPVWLHDILLGYGDPTAANYKSERIKTYSANTVGVTPLSSPLDFGDTFVDESHLRNSFQGADITIVGATSDKGRCNYKLKFVEENAKIKIEATPYPFPSNTFVGNQVPFTPVQVEAIRSGLSSGLTLVVGPPGTGKTDVAVQIIANLFHSFPSQRTIIITHSNAALNDLFEKVMTRGDIEERYMIRLGSGERDLRTTSDHDFTKNGRVQHSLQRRGILLEAVQLLSESLGVSSVAERGVNGEPSYNCQSAEYFYLHHVVRRIQLFEQKVDDMNIKNYNNGGVNNSSSIDVLSIFPFKEYFNVKESVPVQDAFHKISSITNIFSELAEYRPLELLRSQRQRTDYLLTKQARIVAMTCTHAAIARSHLIDLSFQYDNIVVEEAGQMLEIETFIPFLLQKGEADETETCRLKRVCLIGDHNQLPPVVKNIAFQKFSNLDQSMFYRLIRLNVPYIQLNFQGRARADIAKLYSWRYNNLGNLEHVQALPAYEAANAGFAHCFQFINVLDFEGKGESTPAPYYYQNLGEAEYIVAIFQYMVLIGYPPEKISILTTYNGQKDLIGDIVERRCGPGTPLAGIRPFAISTVDQYQGQQNDYILLSLVRTSAIGHIRDVRRLTVAVSRARLGLYVVGRKDLFDACHELQPAMQIFGTKPCKLQLVSDEKYDACTRNLQDKIDDERLFVIEDLTSLGLLVHSMQEELAKRLRM